MSYDDFLKLSRDEQEACLDAFMAVLFGDKAKDACEHMRECTSCRDKYANMFADFMTDTKVVN